MSASVHAAKSSRAVIPFMTPPSAGDWFAAEYGFFASDSRAGCCDVGSAGLLRLRVCALVEGAAPIADVCEQRRCRRPDAEVPMNVVRRGSPSTHGAGVDPMEMMRRADPAALLPALA